MELVSTPVFEASARRLLTEDDRRELELLLAVDPTRGAVIPGAGGVRKLRFARRSRREGKSGGTRVIYYFVDTEHRIYLLDMYSKRQKEDLTRAELKTLRVLARSVREDGQ